MTAAAALSRRAATLALVALLGACATRRPVGSIGWSGRLALRVDSQPPQAFSALFDLHGTAEAGELQLTSVLGQTLATVRWSAAGAELQRGDELQRRGSLDELTRELTGAPLPVVALFDWLAGRASEAGGWQADLSGRPQGRLVARRAQPAPAAELRLVVQMSLLRLYDLPAPAKVNLFLHVVGRRADGYHLLQSVFMLIDWCDRLHLERRHDGRIARDDLTPGELPADDLCVRAARTLQQATGCPLGVQISLDKRLPSQAGLGGGSSDAATVLLALNRLWGLNLPRAELTRIGLALGADVPFFIGGRNAWVEGIGERITPLDLPAGRLVVVKPPGGASTPAIFGSPTLKRDSETATIQGFAANSSSNLGACMAFGRNDLQPVAQALCPEVGECIDWLASQGLSARMSGSGTAVFAALPDDATNLDEAPHGWQVRVCSNMDVHPLADWCAG